MGAGSPKERQNHKPHEKQRVASVRIGSEVRPALATHNANFWFGTLAGAGAPAATRLPALRGLKDDLHPIVQLQALQNTVNVNPNGIHR